MNILKYTLLSEEETLARLKRTPLRGFGNAPVYQNANLCIVEQVAVTTLTPPQRYVLNGSVQNILELADTFGKLGVDIFALRGALLFWPEGSNPEIDPAIPFLPPIVEDSIEKDGRLVKLVNDGMHRVFAARKRGRRINIIYVTNVPREYPYYAYAFRDGWQAVQEFDELPDVFQKKEYRNPESYKDLFRQFNKVFPGVQEQRKQSNPDHIKA